MKQISANTPKTDVQEPRLTEGLYQGTCSAQVVAPFIGTILAASTASLAVNLVQNTEMTNQFNAVITVNGCTYSPESLRHLFPEVNINTTAQLIVHESTKHVTVKGVIPFVSSDEMSSVLNLSQEPDGSISIQSKLLTFSIFAKVKKQAESDVLGDQACMAI